MRIFLFIKLEYNDFTDSSSEYQPSSNSSSPSGSPITSKIRRELSVNNIIDTNYSPQERVRKRKLNPNDWIKNKIKYARIHGLGYNSTITNKAISAKKLGPSCFPKCRQKCFQRITEFDREQNFSKFYSLEDNVLQWQYIINHVNKVDKKVTKVISGKSRRTCTYIYTLTSYAKNTKEKVCSKLFLNTLSISCRMVNTPFSKLTLEDGNIQGDMRGRHSRKSNEINERKKDKVKEHINSFAPIESHYLRSRTTRKYIDGDLTVSKMHRLFLEWLKEHNDNENNVTLRQYRDIFNGYFNIGFYIPKKDRCNECSKYEYMTDEEKEKNKDKHNMHIFSKQKARVLKEIDKISSVENESVFGFQKILTVPCEKTSICYYIRK